MDKVKILNYLNSNELSEIEELPYKDDALVVRFFYDFDEDEIKSAKAYANDESEGEKEDDEWYEEFFLPYLNDLAIDNVGEILEDSMEELNLDVQYISYEADSENYDYCEFIAVFFEKGENIEIEDVMDKLEL
jgi:hypothetical protein